HWEPQHKNERSSDCPDRQRDCAGQYGFRTHRPEWPRVPIAKHHSTSDQRWRHPPPASLNRDGPEGWRAKNPTDRWVCGWPDESVTKLRGRSERTPAKTDPTVPALWPAASSLGFADGNWHPAEGRYAGTHPGGRVPFAGLWRLSA